MIDFKLVVFDSLSVLKDYLPVCACNFRVLNEMNNNSINFVPSSFVRDLPEAVMSRYLEKIAIVNNVDPFSVKTNSTEIPVTVSVGMVVHYLLNYQSPFSKHVGANEKSMEAYQKFESGYVSSVTGSIVNDFYIVHGKVNIFLLDISQLISEILFHRFYDPCGCLNHHIVCGLL